MQGKILIYGVYYLFMISIILSPVFIFAQTQPTPPPGPTQQTPPPSGGSDTRSSYNLENPLDGSGINSFADVMQRIANIAIQIGLPLVVVFLVYSGFLFVSARGSEDKLNNAKQTFFWAVIGALLVVGSYAIATAIQNFAQRLQ